LRSRRVASPPVPQSRGPRVADWHSNPPGVSSRWGEGMVAGSSTDRPGDRDVFVSHATEDHERASRLAGEVERWGYKCFVSSEDLNALLGTRSWSETIDALLVDVPVLIVLVTERSLESKWVTYEWRAFHDDVLGERRAGLIVPVLCEGRGIETLPVALRHWQVVDLVGLGEAAGLAALRELVDGFRAAVASSPHSLDRALRWSASSRGGAGGTSLEPVAANATPPPEMRERPQPRRRAFLAVALASLLGAALVFERPTPKVQSASAVAFSPLASNSASHAAVIDAPAPVDPGVEPRAGWEPIELFIHPVLDRQEYLARVETWRGAEGAFEAVCTRECTRRQTAAAHFCAGERMRLDGKQADAMAEFAAASAADPSWAVPLVGTAVAALPTNPQNALESARTAFDRDPTLWIALMVKGSSFAWMGQFVPAVEEMLEARRLAPADATPLIDARIAMTYHSEGLRNERAAAMAKQACNEHVRVAPACTVLAEQALEQGQTREVFRVVELADRDDFTPLVLVQGDAYQLSGQTNLAWLAWKRVAASPSVAISQGAPPARVAAILEAVRTGAPPSPRKQATRSRAPAPPLGAVHGPVPAGSGRSRPPGIDLGI
jgi:hypothetical protein